MARLTQAPAGTWPGRGGPLILGLLLGFSLAMVLTTVVISWRGQCQVPIALFNTNSEQREEQTKQAQSPAGTLEATDGLLQAEPAAPHVEPLCTFPLSAAAGGGD